MEYYYFNLPIILFDSYNIIYFFFVYFYQLSNGVEENANKNKFSVYQISTERENILNRELSKKKKKIKN